MLSECVGPRARSSRVIAAGLFGALSLGVALAFGCQKESLSAAEASAEPATVSSGAAAAGVAKTKLSESSFELEIKPNGAYKAGQPGAVEIVLVAKAPYKVNDKYPYKFKAKPTDGVKYANPVVKDKVELEPKRARMKVEFVPESAGTKQVAGQFAFSVCTDERCLIEKRDLTLDVKVN